MMIKKFILVIIIFSSFFSYAQYNDWTPAIIYLKGGTVLEGRGRLSMSMHHTEPSFGVIKVGNKEYLRFVRGKEHRSIKFEPTEVYKVVFSVENKEKGERVKKSVVFIPIIKAKRKNTIKMGFAELVIDGKVKLVKKKISGVGIVKNCSEELLLVRSNELAVQFNYLGEFKSFRKRAKEYFYDCPYLISKIENKEYKYDDLEVMVEYYNENCAK